MLKKSTPKITKCTDKPYTKITFIPDLEKFNMRFPRTPKQGIFFIFDCLSFSNRDHMEKLSLIHI